MGRQAMHSLRSGHGRHRHGVKLLRSCCVPAKRGRDRGSRGRASPMLSGSCSSERPLLLLSWSPHRCSTLLSASSATPPEESCREFAVRCGAKACRSMSNGIFKISQSSCCLLCTLRTLLICPQPLLRKTVFFLLPLLDHASAPYLVRVPQSQEHWMQSIDCRQGFSWRRDCILTKAIAGMCTLTALMRRCTEP